MLFKLMALVLLFSIPCISVAHPGGLDSNGCHFKRATGEYHCHRGSYLPPDQGQNNSRNSGHASPNYLVPQVDSTCYTGPRGGRYRIVNGRKRYGC